MPTFKTHANFTAHYRLVSALHHLYNSIDASSKSPADLLPIAVFLAFSIESYINHLGSRHIKNWDKLERRSWKKKLDILHEDRGKQPNWDDYPLLFVCEIFELRKRLAHGKPESVNGPEFSSYQEALEFIENDDIDPKWFENINEVWLRESQKRFIELMEYMAAMYGLSPTNYFHASTKSVTGPYE